MTPPSCLRGQDTICRHSNGGPDVTVEHSQTEGINSAASLASGSLADVGKIPDDLAVGIGPQRQVETRKERRKDPSLE